jgi:uncharacterized protein (UPF0335 family)
MAKMKETEADKAVTAKALENAGAALLAVVVGLEELAERMAELKGQAKAKLDAAKAEGFDPKAIRALLRERAKTETQIKAAEELALIVKTYAEAVDLAEEVA